MDKLGTVKETPLDIVELFRDHFGILIRRLEVCKDDTCVLHKIELNAREAEVLVSLLQKSIGEIRGHGEPESQPPAG